MNTFQILKQDHKKLSQLFNEVLHTSSRSIKTRENLFEEIKSLLDHHALMEEDILYPVLKDISTSHLQTAESYEEHHLMKIVLKELNTWQKNNDDWLGKMKTLKDLVEHHAQEEEKTLFPMAEKLLKQAQLNDIQDQIARYKHHYEQEKAHPGLWGKVYMVMNNSD